MVLNDGSWIAPPGEYQDLAKDLCGSDPRLCQQDKKLRLEAVEWSARPARVILLEFGDKSVPRGKQTVFSDAEKLREGIYEREANRSRYPPNATYIIEGLNRDFVGILGSYFGVHPSIFMEHERLSHKSSSLDRGLASLLASSLAMKPYVSMSYHEVFTLPDGVRGIHRLRCPDTGRYIRVTRCNGEVSSTGMINRVCIFWSRKRPTNDGWDSIVICNPPLQKVRTLGGLEFPIVPGPGGYVDFIPEHIQVQCRQGPPRTSLAADLCFYLTTHRGLVNSSFPDSVFLFLKKIVASHYTGQFDYLRENMRRALLTMRRQSDFTGFDLSAVEANWSDVQTLIRRLDHYCHDLEEILIQLRISLHPPDPSKITSWQDTEADFRLLYHRFNSLRQYGEIVNSSMTGLTSITGNRQAFKEQELSLRAAERSRNLTFIGLVFIPLAFISSLFSMSEPYGPGGDQFWLYFAISVPAAAVVVAAYYMVDFLDSRSEFVWSISSVSDALRGLLLARSGGKRSGQSFA